MEALSKLDSLIRLVKESPEISFSDVAERLEIDDSTVKALANYLEDEGLADVVYREGKGFIVSKELKSSLDEDALEIPPAPEEEKQGFLSKIFGPKHKEEAQAVPLFKSKKTEYKPEEDLLSLKDSVASLGIKNEKLVTKKKKVKPSATKTGQDMVDKMVGRAKDLISTGNFKEARDIYLKLKKRYDRFPDKYEENRNRLVDELIKLNLEITRRIESVDEKSFSEKEKEIKDIAQEIKKDISKQNMVRAKSEFVRLQGMFESLPKGFIERKTSLKSMILDLHDELLHKEAVLSRGDFDSKVNKIEGLVKKAVKEIAVENVQAAEDIYKRIKAVQNILPPGFLKERIDVGETIISLYEQLVELKVRKSSLDVGDKAKEINDLLDKIGARLRHDELRYALELYEKVKALYLALPKGFIEKQSELSKKLLNIEKQLLFAKLKNDRILFREKYKRIKKQLKLIKSYLKEDIPGLAGAVYEEAIELYNSLPPGFIRRKAAIRKELLSLYKGSIYASDTLYLKSFDTDVKKTYLELLQMIHNSHILISVREFTAFQNVILSLNKLYEKLPIGFAKSKLKVVSEISKLNDIAELVKMTSRLAKLSKDNFKQVKPILSDIVSLYDSLKPRCREDVELFKFVQETIYPYALRQMEKTKQKPKKEGTLLKKARKEVKKRQLAAKHKKAIIKVKSERVKRLKQALTIEKKSIRHEEKKAEIEDEIKTRQRKNMAQERKMLEEQKKAVEMKKEMLRRLSEEKQKSLKEMELGMIEKLDEINASSPKELAKKKAQMEKEDKARKKRLEKEMTESQEGLGDIIELAKEKEKLDKEQKEVKRKLEEKKKLEKEKRTKTKKLKQIEKKQEEPKKKVEEIKAKAVKEYKTAVKKVRKRKTKSEMLSEEIEDIDQKLKMLEKGIIASSQKYEEIKVPREIQRKRKKIEQSSKSPKRRVKKKAKIVKRSAKKKKLSKR